MNPRRVVQCLVILTLLLFPPLSAFAFSGRTLTDVNMRSGPGRSFRVIAVLRARTPVSIFQCTRDRRWCNVEARRQRGWVYARYLSQTSPGRSPRG